MNYKVILFDADDTLFDFQKSEKKAFEKSMKEFCNDYDENFHFATYKEINTAIWKEFENGLITQSNLKVERFKRLGVKLNIVFDEEIFAASYMNHLGSCSYLLEGADELVKDLSKQYTLAIITNGLTKVQERRIKQSEIATFFKNIVISEELGIAKPNAEIFEHALTNLGDFKKEEVLMVGDSLNSDIRGGINANIDTCWFNPNNLENKTNVKPTYQVANFKELRNLLLK
ncbi:MAG: noncanonical pyrimidine nucleotidase, YjjG family [Clostridium sp.]|nr:noncanonical pyrimidine nucleotidase, YjjG family [Clostridium sp.]